MPRIQIALADAICDRLLHNTYKIELKGDSMRKNQSESTTTSLAANQKNEKGGNLAMMGREYQSRRYP